ncbi:PP2C family protein-serine/threonine phosphatase [Nocardia sp. NPDC002869]|uniref:PP2C family protein-serine/threonine phosphatase n=1 Tax=Nocardia sp. NPDC002869 TaxID=3161032 RepID=UPI00398CE003
MLGGRIAKINATLLGWLGYRREDLVGRRHFNDLLTVGGRLYHETHFAPLLRMQGHLSGIALELQAADGSRLPVLVTSTVKTGADGEPLLIRTTVFDARERRAYETELLRARREADRDRERLQRLNATLQRTMLPAALEPVPGADVAAPDEVGGDFYDLFPISPGTWGFFLGDVCGKGAVAATITSLARYTLRAAAVYDADPAAVLRHLNTTMVRDHRRGHPRFCTVIYGRLTLTDEAGGPRATVTLASGGHPPALLLRADGTADYLHTPGGQLVGVFPDAAVSTVTFTLEAGATLLLYTDGLTEAWTAEGFYGESALPDFARDLAPASATGTVSAASALLDSFGAGVTDDTALLTLHLPGPEHLRDRLE